MLQKPKVTTTEVFLLSMTCMQQCQFQKFKIYDFRPTWAEHLNYFHPPTIALFFPKMPLQISQITASNN